MRPKPYSAPAFVDWTMCEAPIAAPARRIPGPSVFRIPDRLSPAVIIDSASINENLHLHGLNCQEGFALSGFYFDTFVSIVPCQAQQILKI